MKEHLLKIPKNKNKTYGINSLVFRRSILWNSIPSENKTFYQKSHSKESLKIGHVIYVTGPFVAK